MLLQSTAFPVEGNKCDGTPLFILGLDKEHGHFTTWQAVQLMFLLYAAHMDCYQAVFSVSV